MLVLLMCSVRKSILENSCLLSCQQLTNAIAANMDCLLLGNIIK